MKLEAVDIGFYGGVATLVAVVAVFFAIGAFRGDGTRITSWSSFVFGEGPWIVWHFILLVSLSALGVGLVIAAAAPADGIGMAFFVLLPSLGVLMLMTLADGVLWSTTLFDSWAARYLGGPLLIFVAWLALLALLMVYNLVLTYFMSGGWAGPVALIALATGIAVLNLYALHA